MLWDSHPFILGKLALSSFSTLMVCSLSADPRFPLPQAPEASFLTPLQLGYTWYLRGNVQYPSLCVWLVSVGMILTRSHDTVACVEISFLLVAGLYSIVNMDTVSVSLLYEEHHQHRQHAKSCYGPTPHEHGELHAQSNCPRS